MADSGRGVTGGIFVALILATIFSSYALYSERRRLFREQEARATPVETLPTPIVATRNDPAAAREYQREGDRELDSGRLQRARWLYYQAALHDQECSACRAKLQRVETMLYDEIRVALNEGDAALEQHRYEDAIRAFERVLLLDPGLPKKRSLNFQYATRKLQEARTALATAER